MSPEIFPVENKWHWKTLASHNFGEFPSTLLDFGHVGECTCYTFCETEPVIQRRRAAARLHQNLLPSYWKKKHKMYLFIDAISRMPLIKKDGIPCKIIMPTLLMLHLLHVSKMCSKSRKARSDLLLPPSFSLSVSWPCLASAGRSRYPVTKKMYFHFSGGVSSLQCELVIMFLTVQ